MIINDSDGNPLKSMEIVERNGKFFVLCLDGEMELSRDDIERGAKAEMAMKEYIETWRDKYSHNNWTVGDVPKDADAYLYLDDFF